MGTIVNLIHKGFKNVKEKVEMFSVELWMEYANNDWLLINW